MNANSDKIYIDPDPFTVISLVLSGVGVLLQLPHTYEFLKDKFPNGSSLEGASNSTTMITNLENSIDEASMMLNRVIKSIERGSKSPNEEFYEMKFGISLGIMKLEASHQKTFSNDLVMLYSKMSALSLWSNHIIRADDALTSELGRRLSEKCEDAHVKLNKMMTNGAKNGEILAEARYIFESMKSILSDMSQTGN